MENLLQDLRYAVRTLRKHPGFTTIAVITLAIGIGANTAIFSVLKAVLLTPLPFEQPDRLAMVYSVRDGELWTASPADYVDWRQESQAFVDLGAVTPETFILTGSGPAERISGASMTPSLLSTLGVAPALGRAIHPDEAIPGADRIALVGHSLWQRQFGEDPSILGSTVMLDGDAYTIVGVMPPEFEVPNDAEIWVPLAFTAEDLTTQRGAHYLTVVGRLQPGADLETADAEMRAIARRLESAYPETNTGWSATVMDLHESVVGDVRPAMLLLLAAVGLLLLIACANVASLVLARTVDRDRELAIRTALGAGRGRVIRALLTESLVLGLLGGTAGVLLATWGADWLSSLQLRNIPRLDQTGVDVVVLLFAITVSCVTALIFGILPARRAASRRDLTGRLKEGGRGLSGDYGGRQARNALVVAQITLAVVLVVGAGLLMKSFVEVRSVDPGFDTEGLLTFNVSLPETRYPEPEASEAYFAELLGRIEGLPGVEAAAGVFGLPLTGFFFSITVSEIDGRPTTPEDEPSVQVRVTTPEYFQTLGIPLLRGRGFLDTDRAGSRPVIVVNEAAARLLWPGEDPVGHSLVLGTSFGLGRGNAGGEVVGVVRDVKHFGLAARSRAEVYMAHLQFPVDFMTLTVRSSGDPRALIGSIRTEAGELDPEVPIYQVRTMDQLISGSLGQRRFYMLLLTLFALGALTLAAVGVYGVISYGVVRRTREIGLRIALGAEQRDVLGLILRQGMVLAASGLGLGLLGSLATTHWLSALLYGVEPTDPATFTAVALLLVVVAFVASFVPAWRASALDPMIALQNE